MSFNKQNVRLAKTGFQFKCICLLIEGFNDMKKAGRYSVSWKEEKLSAQLIYFMSNSSFATKWNFKINPEQRLYSEEIIFGEKEAENAPRIDIQILSWQNDKASEYFLEAKNLCENDWVKEKGSKVQSSNQLNRYISKGIKHFFSSYYPQNGCMCGYVLEGDIEKIIYKLNKILVKKSMNQLLATSQINGHKYIYKISDNGFELLNLFLDF